MAWTLPPPDTKPYGIAFAERVARKLSEGGSVYYKHRDYCGMGLWCEDGWFCYDEVWDCGPMPVQELLPTADKRGARFFDTRHAFVEWLAVQSDHSLSGLELKDEWLQQNQRITRERLETELG